MATFLIVAHAPLASALQAVAQHAFPECSRQLAALDVAAGAGLEQVETEVRRALAEMPGDGHGETLVLVDVFGATPCNAALRAADGQRVRVVTGVNVPMVWRTLCYSALPLDELVQRAVDGARNGAMQVAEPRRQNQAAPAASADDQVQHHHQ